MSRIGEKQLEKIVAAASEKIGLPLRVTLNAGMGYMFAIVDAQGRAVIPPGTTTEMAQGLEVWVHGYLYARLYSGATQKHGWQQPKYPTGILNAADR